MFTSGDKVKAVNDMYNNGFNILKDNIYYVSHVNSDGSLFLKNMTAIWPNYMFRLYVEEKVIDKNCNCDMITLMQFGCSCGAIRKYQPLY